MEFVYVSIDIVSGIILYDFVLNSVLRKVFSADQQTPTSKILSLFWYLLVQLLLLPPKFHLPAADQNAQKLLSTDLVNTKSLFFGQRTNKF